MEPISRETGPVSAQVRWLLTRVVDAVGAQTGLGVEQHGGLDLMRVALLGLLAQAPALDLLEQRGPTDHAGAAAPGPGGQAGVDDTEGEVTGIHAGGENLGHVSDLEDCGAVFGMIGDGLLRDCLLRGTPGAGTQDRAQWLYNPLLLPGQTGLLAGWLISIPSIFNSGDAGE